MIGTLRVNLTLFFIQNVPMKRMDLGVLTNVNAIMMLLVITCLVFVSAHRAGEVASVTKDAQWDFLDKIARVSAVVLTEQFAITSLENVDVHQVTLERGRPFSFESQEDYFNILQILQIFVLKHAQNIGSRYPN